MVTTTFPEVLLTPAAAAAEALWISERVRERMARLRAKGGAK